MARIRLGILGAGSITERGLLPHLALDDAQQLVEVVALCDVHLEAARGLATQYGIHHACGELSEMVSGCELDAVLVATPIPLHFQQIKTCLASGLHVHTQKTLASTAAQGQELYELATKRDLRLAASPGQMLLPAFKRAKELIDSGSIGRPYQLWAFNAALGHETEPVRQHGGTSDPSWYYRRGGGPLADMGIYSIHAMIGAVGSPTNVVAISARPVEQKRWGDTTIELEVDDSVSLLLGFENGMLGTLCTAFAHEPAIVRWGHLTIVGENGTIEVRRSAKQPGTYDIVQRTGDAIEELRFDHGLNAEHESMEEAHVYLDVLDFIDAIRDHREPRASALDACRALAVLDAAQASLSSRSVQQVQAIG